MADEHTVGAARPTEPADRHASRGARTKAGEEARQIRSAWISFVGRIVAQIMGAVATISLGLMLVQSIRTGRPRRRRPAQWLRSRPSPCGSSLPARLALAVLPLQNVSAEARRVVRARDDRGAHHRSGPPRRGPRRVADVFGALRQRWAAAPRDRARARRGLHRRWIGHRADGRVADCGSPDRRPARRALVSAESYDRPLRQILSVQAKWRERSRSHQSRPGGARRRPASGHRVATEPRTC